MKITPFNVNIRKPDFYSLVLDNTSPEGNDKIIQFTIDLRLSTIRKALHEKIILCQTTG
jgi:hypothetical protein